MIRTELNVKLLFQVVNRGFGDTPMTWKEEMLPRAFLIFLLSSFFMTKLSSGQPNHWVLLPIELVKFFSISFLDQILAVEILWREGCDDKSVISGGVCPH